MVFQYRSCRLPIDAPLSSVKSKLAELLRACANECREGTGDGGGGPADTVDVSRSSSRTASGAKLKIVPLAWAGWPRTADIAITTRKGSGLADPLTLAINALIANGSYRKVLGRWSLDAEAIDQSQTNPPGLPRT